MSIARLAYWLGPWTSDTRAPTTVIREETRAPEADPTDRPMRVRFYRPEGRDPDGALLLVQGLHYAGPDDPRMDRFAAILASSGILVCAPFLPDFAELRVGEGLVRDTARAFELLETREDRPRGAKPGVFSISFGSYPALRLASSEAYADRVAGVVVFGGYADLGETIAFCLEGAEGFPHDPLNRPVVFLNLLDELEGVPADPSHVVTAWDGFVRRTWGRPEMKAIERFVPVVHELAEGIEEPDARQLFLEGCGLEGGGVERARAALDVARERFARLDPRPYLGGLRCPLYVVHGRDDDVIPYTQAERLREAAPRHVETHLYLTGFYAHTSTTGLLDKLRDMPRFAGDLRSMVGILRAISRISRG